MGSFEEVVELLPLRESLSLSRYVRPSGVRSGTADIAATLGKGPNGPAKLAGREFITLEERGTPY